MKTVLFLFTIFIAECFSDTRVYLIETEDKEAKTRGTITTDLKSLQYFFFFLKEIEAGSDYGDDGPSAYGEKPKSYERKTTTTPKIWTTTTTKKWTTVEYENNFKKNEYFLKTTKWETTTTWKPKTTTTVENRNT